MASANSKQGERIWLQRVRCQRRGQAGLWMAESGQGRPEWVAAKQGGGPTGTGTTHIAPAIDGACGRLVGAGNSVEGALFPARRSGGLQKGDRWEGADVVAERDPQVEWRRIVQECLATGVRAYLEVIAGTAGTRQQERLNRGPGTARLGLQCRASRHLSEFPGEGAKGRSAFRCAAPTKLASPGELPVRSAFGFEDAGAVRAAFP